MNIETSFCLPNKCAEHYWKQPVRHNQENGRFPGIAEPVHIGDREWTAPRRRLAALIRLTLVGRTGSSRVRLNQRGLIRTECGPARRPSLTDCGPKRAMISRRAADHLGFLHVGDLHRPAARVRRVTRRHRAHRARLDQHLQLWNLHESFLLF